MTRSGFEVEDYRISKLSVLPPGLQDRSRKRKAEQAQTRKKTGLGLAGVGYLTATRGKDLSPHAAEAVTGSASRIGEAARKAKVARKVRALNHITSRGGVAMTAGGLALATEGTINDIRHRRVVQETLHKATNKFEWDPNGDPEMKPPRVRLAEARQAEARDTASSKKHQKIGVGLAVPGIGASVVGLRRLHARPRGRGAIPLLVAGGVANTVSAQQSFKSSYKKLSAAQHRHEGDQLAASMSKASPPEEQDMNDQDPRPVFSKALRRMSAKPAEPVPVPVFSKAYNPERQRHQRAAAYEGIAAGGAVTAAGGAAALQHKENSIRGRSRAYASLADKNRAKATREVSSLGSAKTGAPEKPAAAMAATRLRRADIQTVKAAELAAKARKIRGGKIAAATGAAALAAGAAKIHHYDKKGAGRSYDW